MDGSKLNNRIQGAVRAGAGRVGSGVRGAFQKLKIWQKAGLILCLLSWIMSAVIGAVCGRITGKMTDQNCASRWSPERESAQVSAFLSGSAGMSDETVLSLRSNFSRTLQEDAIALSETQVENGASLFDSCYCGIGNAEISAGDESVTATMIGVGGDFFNFHPLDLMDGFYFTEDELMQDRILLDDETAWRLFGSPHVVGQSVDIGGTPHYIAGVFQRPQGRFYPYSGMGSYMVFISFDSLCRYTEIGMPSGGQENEDSTSTETDAFAPSEAVIATASSRGSAERVLEDAVSAAGTVPLSAAWQPDAFTASAQDRVKNPVEEEEEEPETSSGMSAGTDTEETEDTDKEETTEKEEDDKDLDKPEAGDRESMGGGSGRQSQTETEAPQKEEVNRNRVGCYEVILPNPVSGYALRTSRKCLEESGVASDQYTIVENTSRYDTLRLASLVARPGVRSMQTAAIRYPYWENVALAWEDVLIPFALLQLFLRFAPMLFLLYLVLWYATHKSWTVGGIVQNLQDRLYTHQSERIYGKSSTVDAVGTADGTDASLSDSAEADAALPGPSDAEPDATPIPETESAAADAANFSETESAAADAAPVSETEAGDADAAPISETGAGDADASPVSETEAADADSSNSSEMTGDRYGR